MPSEKTTQARPSDLAEDLAIRARVGWRDPHVGSLPAEYRRFAQLVAEECAKEAEGRTDGYDIAGRIRAKFGVQS